MRLSMTKSSSPSESIFSPETEKQVKDIFSRVSKFRTEVEDVLCEYRLPPIQDACKLIENLFLKFHSVAKQIEREQRHEKRRTLEMKDEYDVQDLLHGLLRIYFDDVRKEEWTPSCAGTCARMDFLLRKEQIAIEAKMTRNGLGKKKLSEELIIDKAHYKTHPYCKTLYCLVYDPKQRISNPKGFESDLSDRVEDFETKVLIVPKI